MFTPDLLYPSPASPWCFPSPDPKVNETTLRSLERSQAKPHIPRQIGSFKRFARCPWWKLANPRGDARLLFTYCCLQRLCLLLLLANAISDTRLVAPFIL